MASTSLLRRAVAVAPVPADAIRTDFYERDYIDAVSPRVADLRSELLLDLKPNLIADDLKLLSTAEKLLEIPSFALVVGAGGLVGGGEHAYTCCAATVGGGGLLFAPWRFSAAASTVRVSAHPLTLRLAVFSVRRARPDQRAAG